jgi:hypothetical protein
MDLSAGISVGVGHQGMGILLGNESRKSWVQNLIDEVEYKGKYGLDIRVAPTLGLEGNNFVSMHPIVVDDVASGSQPLVDAAYEFRSLAEKNEQFINEYSRLYSQTYNLDRYVDKVAAVAINDGTNPAEVANALESEFTIVEVLDRFSVVQVFPDVLNAERKMEDMLPAVNYDLEYSKPKY